MSARSARTLGVAAAAFTLVLTGLASSAVAAVDQTPPVLTVGVKPAFVVGSQVSVSPFCINDPEAFPVDCPYASDIAQLVTWSATDDVGVCSYDLIRVFAGVEPEPVFLFSQETQYLALDSDYNGDFGGGSTLPVGFLVTARDCTGNATTKVVVDRPVVTQETGQSATGPEQVLTYTGNWATTFCSCFLWEGTRRTSAPGARVSFTRTYDEGDHVALVMATGPLRGRAGIRIDGRWVKTVDTFASVNTNRIVVFERLMSAGEHTITIVNHATPGRPRIDLDAIITN
jgi:hypothetical protein